MQRTKWRAANQVAGILISKIEPLVTRVMVAGSVRRLRPTVGDLDIVIARTEFQNILLNQWFMDNFGIQTSNRTKGKRTGKFMGIEVQFIDVLPEQWGSALLMATGSGDHNVIMRGRAKKLGLKLNQYGLFRDNEPIVVADREDVIFAALNMVPLLPYLREVKI
jgi:DNA polymerase (family X)